MKNVSKSKIKDRNRSDILANMDNLRQFAHDQIELNKEINNINSSFLKKTSHQNIHSDISKTPSKKKLHGQFFNSRIDPLFKIDTRFPTTPDSKTKYDYSTKSKFYPKEFKTKKDQTISEISAVISPNNIISKKKKKNRSLYDAYDPNSKSVYVNPVIIDTFDDLYEYDLKDKIREQNFHDFRQFQLKSLYFDIWNSKWKRYNIKKIQVDLEYFKKLNESLNQKEKIIPEEEVAREIARLRKKKEKFRSNGFYNYNSTFFSDSDQYMNSSQIIRFVQSQSSLESDIDIDNKLQTPPIYDSQNESDGPPLFMRNRLSYYQLKVGNKSKKKEQNDPPLFFEDLSENERFFAALNCNANLRENENAESPKKKVDNEIVIEKVSDFDDKTENNYQKSNDIPQSNSDLQLKTSKESGKESYIINKKDSEKSKERTKNKYQQNVEKTDLIEEEEENDIMDSFKDSSENQNKTEEKSSYESNKKANKTEQEPETKNEKVDSSEIQRKLSKTEEESEAKSEESSSSKKKQKISKTEKESDIRSEKNISSEKSISTRENEEESNIKSDKNSSSEKCKTSKKAEEESNIENGIESSSSKNSNKTPKTKNETKLKNEGKSSSKSSKNLSKASKEEEARNEKSSSIESIEKNLEEKNNESNQISSKLNEQSEKSNSKSDTLVKLPSSEEDYFLNDYEDNPHLSSFYTDNTANPRKPKSNANDQIEENSSQFLNSEEIADESQPFEEITISELYENESETEGTNHQTDKINKQQKQIQNDSNINKDAIFVEDEENENPEDYFLTSKDTIQQKNNSDQNKNLQNDVYYEEEEEERIETPIQNDNDIVSSEKENQNQQKNINFEDEGGDKSAQKQISSKSVSNNEMYQISNKEVLVEEEDKSEQKQISSKNVPNNEMYQTFNKEVLVEEEENEDDDVEAEIIERQNLNKKLRFEEEEAENDKNEDFSSFEEEEEEIDDGNDDGYQFLSDSERLFSSGHRIIHNSSTPIFTSPIEEKRYKRKTEIKPLSKEQSRIIFGRLVDFYDSEEEEEVEPIKIGRNSHWSKRFDSSSSTENPYEILKIPSKRGKIKHSSSDDAIVIHIADPEYD